MKRRIISLILGLILMVSLAMPAMAQNRNGVYILDEKEYLSEFECQFYHNQAMALSDQLDMDILYVQTYATDLQTDAQSLNLGSRPNQIMLLDNDGNCDIALFGTAKALSQDHIQQLLNAYCVEPTYPDGVASYLGLAEQIVSDLKENGAFAQQPAVDLASRVVDRAELLDAAVEEQLCRQLDEISQRQQLDVVVITVNSLDGKTAMAYADDFYDDNGYGFGDNHDGILLLVSMEDRDWWISTSGYGINVFTDAGIEYISDCVVPLLSEGEYGKAFDTFAQLCDDFITQARADAPYDGNKLPKEPFHFGATLLICLVIGAVVAWCVVARMKRQLKSVRPQSGAGGYTNSDSPKLTVDHEIYLYSTMKKRPKPKPGNSGGSTTHHSSSGRFHGGGGGKF